MKSDVSSERIVVPHTDGVELVVVRLKFRKMFVYVCCVYIPSGSPVAVYHQYNEAIQRVIEFIDMNIEDRIYILGDFNMTNVSWIPNPIDDDFVTCNSSAGVALSSNCLLPFNID